MPGDKHAGGTGVYDNGRGDAGNIEKLRKVLTSTADLCIIIFVAVGNSVVIKDSNCF